MGWSSNNPQLGNEAGIGFLEVSHISGKCDSKIPGCLSQEIALLGQKYAQFTDILDRFEVFDSSDNLLYLIPGHLG